MKIKTSSSSKTAPEGVTTTTATPTATPTSACRRRCRRAPWSTCDRVLAGLLLAGLIATIVTFTTLKIAKHRGHHDHDDYDDDDDDGYMFGQCKVREIVEQNDVCCPYKGAQGCTTGQSGNLYRKTWYKYKDESTHQRHNMLEDNEDVEENQRNDKFSCYQIVLDYEGSESDEDSSSSSEESHEYGRRGHHHKGHHRGRRDDHEWRRGHHGDHDSHHEDWEERRGEWEEEWEKIRDEYGDDEWSDEDWKQLVEQYGHMWSEHDWRRLREEKQRWMEEEGKMEALEEDDGERHTEEGIVVMNTTASGENRWIFYENQYTQANYGQCSYSACKCSRDKGTEEIEKKMTLWRARMASQESFDCTLMDPNHESDEDDDDDDDYRKHKMHRMFHLLPFVCGGVLLVLALVLIVRRCRANKAMRAATPTQVYEAPISKEAEANLPPSAKEVEANIGSMTKEEEANMPPVYSQEQELANAPSSAPAVVWTTHSLPTYERATELPPEYKSQADMRAMTPVDESA